MVNALPPHVHVTNSPIGFFLESGFRCIAAQFRTAILNAFRDSPFSGRIPARTPRPVPQALIVTWQTSATALQTQIKTKCWEIDKSLCWYKASHE